MAKQRGSARTPDDRTKTVHAAPDSAADNEENEVTGLTTDEPAEKASVSPADEPPATEGEHASDGRGQSEPSIEEEMQGLRDFLSEGERRMAMAREELERLERMQVEAVPPPTLLEHIGHSRRITEVLRGRHAVERVSSAHKQNQRRLLQAAQKKDA